MEAYVSVFLFNSWTDVVAARALLVWAGGVCARHMQNYQRGQLTELKARSEELRLKTYHTVLGVLVERAAVIHGGRSSSISHCDYRWAPCEAKGLMMLFGLRRHQMELFLLQFQRGCGSAKRASDGKEIIGQQEDTDSNTRSWKFSPSKKSALCRAKRRVEEGPEVATKRGPSCPLSRGERGGDGCQTKLKQGRNGQGTISRETILGSIDKKCKRRRTGSVFRRGRL